VTQTGKADYVVSGASDKSGVTDESLKSDVSKAYKEWQSSSKPEYKSTHKSDITKAMDELREREFSYDVNSDEAYMRYRDSIKNSAELALADAMGVAASLNGGYATSYAQLAGQSAYTNTMKTADEMIPELYEQAYDRFSEETDNIEDRLELLLEMDDTEWDRYIDMLDQYNEKGETLFDQLRDMSDEEFDRFYSMYKLSVK